MNVTMKELARLCGVSEGTVDRALNHRQGIREETRRRVLEMAEKLQYTPNKLAQSLARGATMTIGIVCFDLHNNLFASLVDAVENAAKEKGYFINLVLTHGEPQKEREGIRYLSQRRVDGLIIFPVGMGEEYASRLKSLKIPVVTVYNRISKDFPYVGVDDRSVFRKAVLHLAQKGYERVLFSTVEYTKRRKEGVNVYALEKRQEGYLEGVREAGLSGGPVILEGRDFPRLLGPYLQKGGPKTAVLCICDTYALEVLDFCRDGGFTPPEGLGVMGYDNIGLLQYVRPRPATVEYNVKKLGETLFSTLYDQMRGIPVPESSFMEYRFVDGDAV